MSEEAEARREHVRAIAITSTASLAGVVAAIVSSVVTSGGADAAATAREAQFAVLALIVVQIPAYNLLFEEWGGAKDVLYVAFMTFIMWFVTYGIILTSGAELV